MSCEHCGGCLAERFPYCATCLSCKRVYRLSPEERELLLNPPRGPMHPLLAAGLLALSLCALILAISVC